jgi:hypothetical protein
MQNREKPTTDIVESKEALAIHPTSNDQSPESMVDDHDEVSA